MFYYGFKIMIMFFFFLVISKRCTKINVKIFFAILIILKKYFMSCFCLKSYIFITRFVQIVITNKDISSQLPNSELTLCSVIVI